MANKAVLISCAAACLGLLLACGGSDDSSGGYASRPGSANTGTGGINGSSTTGGGVVTGTTGGVIEPPPEREVEGSFRAPVATGKYLWSANPDSGRVAIIDTETLEIQVVDAGFGPTYLAALPPSDESVAAAIVINVLSQDATLFELDGEGAVESETFSLHAGANRWSISGGGRWATAWTDAAEVEYPDPTDGFQDITVIDLESHEVTRLSVGYRPNQVVYDEDEARLFVVTEPGISVIELDDDTPETVELVTVDSESGRAEDVNITPDGTVALVRHDGSSNVSIVPLDGGPSRQIVLSGVVTDLDMSDDGSRSVAVVRETSDMFVFDAERLDDPDAVELLHVPGGVFGSVALAPHADVAVLYTNAIDSPEATVVQLEQGDAFLSHRTLDLKGSVQAVFVAPDGEHAVALLNVPEGSTKGGAFSILVTKAERSPKIVGTDAPPVAVALSPNEPSTSVLVTTRDDAKSLYEVHLVSLPSLEQDAFSLASPPIATGILSERALGYVAQSHPEGRITFIDLSQGGARTLTGFELAAKVVD